MARNRIGLQFNGWRELLTNVERMSGTAGLKKAVEDGLKASKSVVNKKVTQAMGKGNLPATGKYSTGDTLKSLDKNFNVEWSGYTATIYIGFDFQESGVKSIFLMYGTPRHQPPMPPVNGLYDAIYGRKTQKEIKDAQKEAINKFIERGRG